LGYSALAAGKNLEAMTCSEMVTEGEKLKEEKREAEEEVPTVG
jgi:hypothetical protein